MAVDATGTPTSPDSILKYLTSADAPSGKGFNNAMDSIQTALTNNYVRKTLLTTTGDIIYASSANTPARLGIGSSTQVLTVTGGVPVWAAGGSASASTALNIGSANTDLAAPSGTLNYWVATTAGGTLRSIGAGTNGTQITLKNGHATSFIRLLHATAGGTGAQLSIIGAGHKFLAPSQSIQFMYDGTNWQEVNRPAKELICSLVLGSAQASIDTDTVLGVASSLPQVYNNLEIVMQHRSDIVAAGQNGLFRFNNDSGANYDYIYSSGSNTTMTVGEVFATTSGFLGTTQGTTSPASVFTESVIKISNYVGTTANKNAVVQAGYKQGTTAGSLQLINVANFWRSTAAITRIAALPNANNWLAGTSFYLYGET